MRLEAVKRVGVELWKKFCMGGGDNVPEERFAWGNGCRRKLCLSKHRGVFGNL